MQVIKPGSAGNNVKLLKHSLNLLMSPSPALAEVDPKFDNATGKAVTAFKQLAGLQPIDAKVDAQTWGEIGQQFATKLPPNRPEKTIGRCFINDVSTAIPDWRTRALNQVLKFIDLDPAVTNLQWAAYMMATINHECANTWQPIQESGKGAGHDYGKLVTVKGSDGETYKCVYYGRGYVQLTWEKNYRRLSEAMGLGVSLVIHPEKALDPETSY